MRAVLLCLLLSLSLWPNAGFGASILERRAPSPPIEASQPAGGNAELYMSAESVLSLFNRKEQNLTLIDIRGPSEFERLGIPGSIRIPLYAIKAGQFLKSRFLVLVHDGYPDLTLEQACKALRDSGFRKVWIMSGGLASWRQRKGPLRGDAPARIDSNRVPPQAFFQKRDSADWTVIDVSSDHPRTLRSIPGAVHVPLSRETGSFIPRLKAALNSKGGSQREFILVCSQRGEDYQGLEILIEQAGIRNVFYLKGGLEGYESFLAHLPLLARPEKKTQQGELRCVTCP
jgi:rhodanese-related sulfurtransferase